MVRVACAVECDAKSFRAGLRQAAEATRLFGARLRRLISRRIRIASSARAWGESRARLRSTTGARTEVIMICFGIGRIGNRSARCTTGKRRDAGSELASVGGWGVGFLRTLAGDRRPSFASFFTG